MIMTDKHICTGCCACSNVCRKRCITMVGDRVGFRYPRMDAAACDNCHLCRRMCPLLNGNTVSRARLRYIAGTKWGTRRYPSMERLQELKQERQEAALVST